MQPPEVELLCKKCVSSKKIEKELDVLCEVLGKQWWLVVVVFVCRCFVLLFFSRNKTGVCAPVKNVFFALRVKLTPSPTPKLLSVNGWPYGRQYVMYRVNTNANPDGHMFLSSLPALVTKSWIQFPCQS